MLFVKYILLMIIGSLIIDSNKITIMFTFAYICFLYIIFSHIYPNSDTDLLILAFGLDIAGFFTLLFFKNQNIIIKKRNE
jgi:hypothetical protein